MLFAIMCEDIEDSLELRKSTRPEHLKWLGGIKAEGRLVLAGPHPKSESDDNAGFTGSLIVANFADLAAAEDWVANDPYTLAGVFKSRVIKPFLQVF